MKQFGLIGNPLGHSFSKVYFEEKFRKLKLDCTYGLYQLTNINEFPQLWEDNPGLVGVNVTIPYKQSVISYLDELSNEAHKIGAVNVIKRFKSGLKGFNSDYFGFKRSLENWLPNTHLSALVLGTGGASKAVQVALQDLGITYRSVSREKSKASFTYDQIDGKMISEYRLIINTTPLGMSPEMETKPDLPYSFLTSNHYLYDLVYNPENTSFMQEGERRGSKVKNGYEMWLLQAEKSWGIWNS